MSSNRPLVFVDLDDTLFQTARKMGDEPRFAATLDVDGQPNGFMSATQKSFVEWLLATSDVVPVTARSIEAYQRVQLPFAHGAVCAHGGVILNPDGSLDLDWHARMCDQLALEQTRLHRLSEQTLAIGAELGFSLRGWVVEEQGLANYVVTKHNNETDEALLMVDTRQHMAGQLTALGRAPPVALGHKAQVRHAVTKAQQRALAVDRLITADPLAHCFALLQGLRQERQIVAIAVHVQPVQQAPRLDLSQHGEQRLVGFIVVLGDHVIGQALFFYHPAAQREAKLRANGQGLLAQLMQPGLLKRQLVAHAGMPLGIQRAVRVEDHPTVGTDRAMDKGQLHPLIGFDAARSHRDYVAGGQQPLNKTLLGRAHKTVGLTIHIQRGGKAWLIAHFAGGLKQGVIQIDEHQRAITAHQRLPAHSVR